MRILIVKLYPSFELLNALPTVHRLRRDFNAEIHWVVHEHEVELVSCFDDVQRIIVYPEDELKHENRAVFRKSLHQETYDLVVDLQGNMQSALVCKSARKKKIQMFWVHHFKLKVLVLCTLPLQAFETEIDILLMSVWMF